jgi:ribosomal protein L11 methyltransferase
VPYGDLYIYYFRGRIPAPYLPGSPEFIGNWEEDGFSFLFFLQPADSTVRAVLEARPGLELLDQFQMTYEEWLGEKVRPLRAGCFWITPPWQPAAVPRQTDLIPITLDPGVVFGTGTHPTTFDCLEAISTLCRNRTIDTVVDLGTGTGLLAVAACKLGCDQVLALDFNFLAAKTALRNVRLNRMEGRILVVQGRAEEYMDRPVDLVISNIHYDVMKELIGSELFLGHRWFILSGLMRSQAKAVEEQLRRLPVSIISIMQNDGIWHTFLGKSNISV